MIDHACKRPRWMENCGTSSRHPCRAAHAIFPARGDWCKSARRCGWRPASSREQAELRQFLDGMRQGVDADAELAHAPTARRSRSRSRAHAASARSSAPDSAADDDRFHGWTHTAHSRAAIMVRVPRRRNAFRPTSLTARRRRCCRAAFVCYLSGRAGEMRAPQAGAGVPTIGAWPPRHAQFSEDRASACGPSRGRWRPPICRRPRRCGCSTSPSDRARRG